MIRTIKMSKFFSFVIACAIVIAFGETAISVNASEAIDTSTLDNILKAYGNTVSVYYENLQTGYVYRHNADRIYFGASVIKAPYCLYVYQLAEEGRADFNTVHKYLKSHYIGGTGIIQNMKVGTEFTENQLLEYTIRHSDNIALQILINTYGIGEYKDFIANLGGDSNNVKNVMSADMSAEEAGLYAKAIYKYIELDNRYSKKFKEDLMSTSNPMIVSDFPIARKYGWSRKSFHDMAIVYSDSPYVLVIMTDWESGTSKNFESFRDISKAVQTFNESNFTGEKSMYQSSEVTAEKIRLSGISKSNPANKREGTILGQVLNSDIAAYINNQEISSWNVEGKTVVFAEDLVNYGFDVIWNESARSLDIAYNKDKKASPPKVEQNTARTGTLKWNYLATTTRTYIDGSEVRSYNISGKTLVDIEDLAPYGSVAWDASKREIRLATK